MPENHNSRLNGWYSIEMPETEEVLSWYSEASAENADGPESAGMTADTAPKLSAADRKLRRTRIIALVLCALIVLASVLSAVSAHVSAKRRDRETAQRPAAESVPRSEVPDIFGTDDDDGYDEDFRDYFASYYSTSSEVRIERAETGTGVTLTLYPQPAQELSLQEIYQLVSPAVVGVTTYVDGEEYSWGTGVIFTQDGYIITNTHIIQGTDAAVVSLASGELYDAFLVGEDEASDIAVLKIEAEGLPYALFGDSDALRVGDTVAAIGNPLGELYAGTMTNGIVSAIDRNVMNNGHTMTLLQTNTALNEGNSGGPLVNAYGQVVGITNMKIMSVYYSTVEGIGFAIPSSVVKQVADQLIEYGLVLGNPTIGIMAGPVSSEAIEVYGLPEGVYVSEVSDGSDAKVQGLQVGDIILKVNGVPVASVAEVNAIKDQFSVGDTLTLTIYRDGETFDMDIRLVDKSEIH